MDLLEYQAKELFNQVGIPVLPSQTLYDPQEIKNLQIPYPVILKSQVLVGGRSKAGGIRTVENRIDAIATARRIFNLPISGQYPDVILAEAHYNTEREIFLAVVLDYQLQRPLLLGSSQGAISSTTTLPKLEKVIVQEEFSSFYARHLAVKMGLSDNLLQSVSAIIEKMYHLFQTKDLDSIEINPLGINAQGELMVLDGKISVNETALGRHPDLVKLATAPSANLATLTQPYLLNHPQTNGNVGIICNGKGLGLGTWDSLLQKDSSPACCFVIGTENNANLLATPSIVQQLKDALEQLLLLPQIEVVLVNILASPTAAITLSQTIADYIQNQLRKFAPSTTQTPQFVIRVASATSNCVTPLLNELPVHWTRNLDDAVNKAAILAQS